ncbi:MAG: class I SAM-dependent methyltransferase [Deltaproteobacteria bacterium]|nr:MAG: class I SAM-dependent methyltransferase [Deltaproteobacteria bacterium]
MNTKDKFLGRSMEKTYSFYSPFYDLIFGKTLQPGRELAFSYLDKRPYQRILDIGVGTGLTFNLYPDQSYIVGIDISAKMIQQAKKRAAILSNGHQISLYVMDACNLEFEDEFFDAVISPYVITTAKDPLKLCQEMYRVCKKGGQIIIVNHSKSPRGLCSKFEDWLSPLFARVGFVTNLDVMGLLASTEIHVEKVITCNTFNLHKVFVGVRK